VPVLQMTTGAACGGTGRDCGTINCPAEIRQWGGAGAELILLFVVLVGTWVASLFLNPWVKCSKCQGKPKSQGWLYSYAHHFCKKCGGTGQQVRWGSKGVRHGARHTP
jgi:hypothetical protein